MVELRYISLGKLIAAAGGDPWKIDATLQAGRPAQISDLAQAFHSAGQCSTEANNAFLDAQRRFEASWNRENGEHPINDSAAVQRVKTSLGQQVQQLPKIAVDLENVAATLAEVQRASGALISTLDTRLQTLDDWIGQAEDLIDQDEYLLAQTTDPQEIADLENDIARLNQYISDCEHEAIADTKDTLAQVESIRDGYSDYLQKASTNLRTDGYDPAAIQALDAPESPPKPEEPVQVPPPGTSAEDINKWWNSLNDEQRRLLTDQHPPQLGNLNGIPTEVRDTVNRAVMNDDINRVTSAAAQSHVGVDQVIQHPEQYGLAPFAITRYNNAIQTQKGLKIDATNPDGAKNPVFLQTYDSEAFEGRGREAIAIGNPDKADNTTVLVPGTGSSVRDGYLSHVDGRNLYNEARHADPSRTNSVLVWMGYHAPDSLTDLQVGQTSLARAGGSLLATDVNALAVTHQGTSHMTVVGHSYGSTTVADAAAGSGMHANDVVLVGSPGTDLAHSANDFHLPQGGHVYVGAASSDPVTHLGGVQEHVPGTGVTIGLGNDPSVEGYGSTRFKAEVPGATWPWKDHSSYFTPGSESLFSLGDIASGHGDALAHDQMTAPHRGAYWLPNDIDPETIRPGTGGHAH